jgi:hypothetical protein
LLLPHHGRNRAYTARLPCHQTRFPPKFQARMRPCSHGQNLGADPGRISGAGASMSANDLARLCDLEMIDRSWRTGLARSLPVRTSVSRTLRYIDCLDDLMIAPKQLVEASTQPTSRRMLLLVTIHRDNDRTARSDRGPIVISRRSTVDHRAGVSRRGPTGSDRLRSMAS